MSKVSIRTNESFMEDAVNGNLTQEDVIWFFGCLQKEEEIKATLNHLALKRDWKGFDEKFEEQILALQNWEVALRQYVLYYICVCDFECRPWKIHKLGKSAQIKLLQIHNISDVVRVYSANQEFCEEAIKLLFDNLENFKAYVSPRKLGDIGISTMLSLPEKQREKFCDIYFLHHKLREHQELEMLKKLPLNSPSLLRYVERYDLCSRARTILMLQGLQALRNVGKAVVYLNSLNMP